VRLNRLGIEAKEVSMIDLLGDEVPTISRSLIDPLHGFEDWWKSLLPGNKIAKPQCKKKWVKLGCCNNALHIIMHSEFLKTTDKYLRGIIPNPETYLNQQRWLDWEPPAANPKPYRDPTLLAMEAHAKKAVPCPAHLRRHP
jgi:hypothetical protein